MRHCPCVLERWCLESDDRRLDCLSSLVLKMLCQQTAVQQLISSANYIGIFFRTNKPLLLSRQHTRTHTMHWWNTHNSGMHQWGEFFYEAIVQSNKHTIIHNCYCLLGKIMQRIEIVLFTRVTISNGFLKSCIIPLVISRLCWCVVRIFSFSFKSTILTANYIS